MVHWVLPVSKGPSPRGGCACAVLGSRAVFFGGADRQMRAYNDVWVLDTSNRKYQWEQVAATCEEGASIHPMSGSTLTAIGERLYLYGGQDIASGMCHGDILCLDPATWCWSRVQVAGGQQPLPRHSHCAGKLADNCLLVFGGVGDSGQMNDVWIFNTDQRGWTHAVVGGDKPCPREMHSGTMVDSTTMLIYGGRAAGGKVLDDVAVLDAKEMRWRCLEPTPFARCAHSGVTMMRRDVLAAQLQRASGGGSDNAVPMDTSSDSDGPVVVIYGGFSGEAVEGDIFYIDPVTTEVEVVRRGPRSSDSAGTQQPSPRFAHSAVPVPSSFGSYATEMVVFGGVNPGQDLSDLAILRCGGEESTVAPCEEEGVVIEELHDDGTEGHKLKTQSTTIQHKEGLVELKISEAP